MNNVSNKQLNMWKHLWDLFIADGEFRHYYTKTPSYDLVLSDKTLIKNTKGTLYIPPKKKGGEGHFIAYQMIGDKIYIFDPSAYAYQQFSNNPGLAKSISVRSKKSVVKLTNHPQDLCQGDTFCQTWSLAWLNSNLRKFTNAKNQNQAITSIYNIVHTVSNSNKFREYILYEKNKASFNKLVKEAQKKFSIPDSTCVIKDISDFYKFSKSITIHEISRIMMNST